VHASHLKIDNQQLQQEVQRLALMADYLRGIVIRYSQEANRVLDKLKSELYSFSKEDITWTISQNTFYRNEEIV